MSFLSDAALLDHVAFQALYGGPMSYGDFLLLRAAAQSATGSGSTRSVTPGASIVASTDPTPSLTKASNSISSISATPTSETAQFSVNINSAGAVSWPAGFAFNWSSGDPTFKNAQSIVFTVLSGSVAFIYND